MRRKEEPRGFQQSLPWPSLPWCHPFLVTIHIHWALSRAALRASAEALRLEVVSLQEQLGRTETPSARCSEYLLISIALLCI